MSRRILSTQHVGYYTDLGWDWLALSMGHAAVCYTSSRGGCQQSYPEFSGPVLTGGLFLRPDTDIEFRLGAGAGAYASEIGPRVGAAVAQADFAGFVVHHVGIIAGARLIVIPRYQHDKLTMIPFVLGLRVR